MEKITPTSAISFLVEVGDKIRAGLQSENSEVREMAKIADELTDVADYLSAKLPKWISVKDSKKPRHGKECLCICTMPNDPKHEWDYQMVLKWYAYGSNGLVDRQHFQHEGCEGMTVSHWMPLPEPPKEDA